MFLIWVVITKTKLLLYCHYYRKEKVAVEYINRNIGISESADAIASLLTRMCLKSVVTSNGTSVEVEVPPTRHDVIHACDIVEDVAIAYGYNNVHRTISDTNCVGVV